MVLKSKHPIMAGLFVQLWHYVVLPTSSRQRNGERFKIMRRNSQNEVVIILLPVLIHVLVGKDQYQILKRTFNNIFICFIDNWNFGVPLCSVKRHPQLPQTPPCQNVHIVVAESYILFIIFPIIYTE